LSEQRADAHEHVWIGGDPQMARRRGVLSPGHGVRTHWTRRALSRAAQGLDLLARMQHTLRALGTRLCIRSARGRPGCGTPRRRAQRCPTFPEPWVPTPGSDGAAREHAADAVDDLPVAASDSVASHIGGSRGQAHRKTATGNCRRRHNRRRTRPREPRGARSPGARERFVRSLSGGRPRPPRCTAGQRTPRSPRSGGCRASHTATRAARQMV
jgi:hypothetical protein